MIRAFMISFLIGLAIISAMQDVAYESQSQQIISQIHELGNKLKD